MNHTTYRPTKRPPARKPRNGCVSLSPTSDAYQVGRVRVWLCRNAGLLSISLGWVFAFVAIGVPKTHDFAVTIFECAVFAAALMGFGIGWIVRDERGKR